MPDPDPEPDPDSDPDSGTASAEEGGVVKSAALRSRRGHQALKGTRIRV
jgi:hypothetical protein